MSRLRANKWKVARRTVQLSAIFLLLSPVLGFGFFRGTLISGELLGVSLSDPLAALDYALAARTFAADVLFGGLLVLVFYFVVGGRAFCSWVCPVHLVSEVAGRLRGNKPVLRGRPPLSRKYWVLGLVLLLSLVTARPVFEVVSPIGAISQNIALGYRPAGTGLMLNASLLLVLFIFLMEVYVARGWWCGSTCPVGALYALAGRRSPVRVEIDHEACDNCGDCFRVCMVPDVLKPPVQRSTAAVLSGDCSRCMDCVDACTQDALKPRFSTAGRR